VKNCNVNCRLNADHGVLRPDVRVCERGDDILSRVSRNTAPAAPAQNIVVTAINKAELTCCDVKAGTLIKGLRRARPNYNVT